MICLTLDMICVTLADMICMTLADMICMILADMICMTLADIICMTLADMICMTLADMDKLTYIYINCSVKSWKAGDISWNNDEAHEAATDLIHAETANVNQIAVLQSHIEWETTRELWWHFMCLNSTKYFVLCIFFRSVFVMKYRLQSNILKTGMCHCTTLL